MNNFTDSNKILVDGTVYRFEGLSEVAKSQVNHIRFSDVRIAELQNELAVATTARVGYLKFLNAGMDD